MNVINLGNRDILENHNRFFPGTSGLRSSLHCVRTTLKNAEKEQIKTLDEMLHLYLSLKFKTHFQTMVYLVYYLCT